MKDAINMPVWMAESHLVNEPEDASTMPATSAWRLYPGQVKELSIGASSVPSTLPEEWRWGTPVWRTACEDYLNLMRRWARTSATHASSVPRMTEKDLCILSSLRHTWIRDS